jgi:hypothetical protein
MRVPPQFLVHAGEDLLLPALVPGDADPSGSNHGASKFIVPRALSCPITRYNMVWFNALCESISVGESF